jgi:hypothetical protein
LATARDKTHPHNPNRAVMDSWTGLRLPCRHNNSNSRPAGGFVGFLVWLEASGLAEWVRMSVPGYPSMIALHAIGMAVMVGLSLVLDLRLLGWFSGIPPQALHRLLKVAWLGFAVNTLSGTALFSAQATTYIVDPVFMSKIVLVFLGAITAAVLQPQIANAGSWSGGQTPGSTKAIAAVSIVFWLGAIILGRLTAYL